MTIWILFRANIKMIVRNRKGFFWGIILPIGIYVVLSILPLESFAGTESLRYSNYLLPGMIAFTIMQTGLYNLAYWMVDLKARGVIKRLRVTPLTKFDLVLSILLARSLIMIIYVAVLTLVGVIFFEAEFFRNIFYALTFTVLGSFIFLMFGLLIATFAETYESAAPITAAVGMPFMFLGNIFYPIEILPTSLQYISKILPITYLAEGIRTTYLDPTNLDVILKDILGLLIWLVIMFAITMVVFKFEE
jgi:ABC-2 type transport system permease protein